MAAYFAAFMSAVSLIGVALITRDGSRTKDAANAAKAGTDRVAADLTDCKAALGAMERLLVEIRENQR